MTARAKRGLATWQARLTSWADSRLLPAVLLALFGVNLLVGLNWTASTSDNLSSPAYDVGERIMGLTQWGVLFIALTAAAVAAFVAAGRGRATGYIIGALLSGMWGFWSVLFVLAPMGRAGASYTLAALSIGMCVLHIIAGLASMHRPAGVPERVGSHHLLGRV